MSSSSSPSDPTDPSLPSAYPQVDGAGIYLHPLLKPLDENAPFPFFLPTFSRLLEFSYIYRHPHLCINTMTVTNGHTQPAGLLHGGVTATLADDVAAGLSYSYVYPSGYCQTARMTADHLSSANVGDTVYGCAVPVHIGNKMHVIDVYCVALPSIKDKNQSPSPSPSPSSSSSSSSSSSPPHQKKPHTSSPFYLTPYRPEPSHTLSSLLSLIAKHPHFTAFRGRESSLRLVSIVRVTFAVIMYPIPPSASKQQQQQQQQQNIAQLAQSMMYNKWKHVIDQYKLQPTPNITHDSDIGMSTAQHMRNSYPDQNQTQAPSMSDDVARLASISTDVMDRFYWRKPSNNNNNNPLIRCPDTAMLTGIEFMHLSFTHVICRVVVRPYHLNLQHSLHGGVSLCLIEEIGSKAPALYSWPHRSLVGTHLESYFIAAATEGDVLWATATPQHTGQSSHVWNITIVAETKPKPSTPTQPKNTNTDTQNKKQPSSSSQPVNDATLDRLLLQQHPSFNIHPSTSLSQASTLLTSSGFSIDPSHLRIISYGLLSVQFRPFPFPGDSVRVHQHMKHALRQQLNSAL